MLTNMGDFIVSIRNVVLGFLCSVLFLGPGRAQAVHSYGFRQAGKEILDQIEADFRLYGSNNYLYAQSISQRFPSYAWGQGIMFTVLVAAARVDPSYLEAATIWPMPSTTDFDVIQGAIGATTPVLAIAATGITTTTPGSRWATWNYMKSPAAASIWIGHGKSSCFA